MVKLYLGINEDRWNRHPIMPGKYVCVSPVYGKTIRTRKQNRVAIPNEVEEVIEDCGAFNDPDECRLNFIDALARQVNHAIKFLYWSKVTHLASYDWLIDEVWTNGNRSKRRWSEDRAWAAVEETIKAAEFLFSQLHSNAEKSMVLSAQGVTPEQYLLCAKEVIKYVSCQPHRIIFGLGGWCIIGKMRKIMMPVFRETIQEVIPYAASQGVKRVHIWGVVFAPALGELLYECDRFGIELSTDSAGPSWRPAFGEWGYANWRDRNYERAPVEIRGLHRKRHVELTRDWLADLRNTDYYKRTHLLKQESMLHV